MANFNTDAVIDIEPWEFILNCSKNEIKELIEELVEGGYLPDSVLTYTNIEKTYSDFAWANECDKLIRGKHLLTNQDELTIMSITKKIV